MQSLWNQKYGFQKKKKQKVMEVVRLAEETVLKTVGGNTFAGSIPVASA